MGVVSIDTFQLCLNLLSNFHGKNLAIFHLIFTVEIWQRFALDTSQRDKRYSYQAFDMRIRQWGHLIFIAKIWQSLTFGMLWCIGRVSRLCIRCVSTYLHYNEPTTIALSTYPYYKVKSSYDQRGSLTQPLESIIQSAQSPIHMQADIYIYIYNMHHAQCYHTKLENKPEIGNVPRVWPNKVQEM